MLIFIVRCSPPRPPAQDSLARPDPTRPVPTRRAALISAAEGREEGEEPLSAGEGWGGRGGGGHRDAVVVASFLEKSFYWHTVCLREKNEIKTCASKNEPLLN